MDVLKTRVAELLGTRYAIVQAPMAGGFVTPELVAAVSNAGGLGTIAGAMLSPQELQDAVVSVRRLTDKPFGVNLFAPLEPVTAERESVAAMNAILAPFREELGLPEPEDASLRWESVAHEQIAVVAKERVPVFSFAFGIPHFEPVQEAGSVILGTATTVAEAVELEARGVDAVVAQAAEAGGHRGTFLAEFDRSLVGGMALLPQITGRVSVPVLLAGGIMDGRGIVAALALGAEGVQLGTAFLNCPESGTPDTYQQAVAAAADDSTAITAAYSGRPARAIRTPLTATVESSGVALLPYPLQALLLQDIRTAAAQQGRGDLLFLLAGQGTGLLRRLPAGELVGVLVRETEETVRHLARTP